MYLFPLTVTVTMTIAFYDYMYYAAFLQIFDYSVRGKTNLFPFTITITLVLCLCLFIPSQMTMTLYDIYTCEKYLVYFTSIPFRVYKLHGMLIGYFCRIQASN